MAINISGTTITFNDATTQTTAAVPGGDYIMTTFTSSGTWTKPAGLKAVKVTVIGAGGNGGNGGTSEFGPTFGGNGGGGGGAIEYLDAPAIPGPVTVTVGTAPSKTSSFGAFLSATGGTNGTAGGGVNPAPTGPYAGGSGSGGTVNFFGDDAYGTGSINQYFSGGAALGFAPAINASANPSGGQTNGRLYGGGGTGRGGPGTAASGAAGIVIVEEFY